MIAHKQRELKNMNTIKPTTLNHESNALLITIKNDQKLLNQVFAGMFTIARRVLGYVGINSSHPFISTQAYLGHNLTKGYCETHLKTDGLVLLTEIYPHTKNKPAEGTSHYAYLVSMEKVNNSLFFVKAMSPQHDEFNKDMVNVNKVMNELFVDYFDDMIEYAKVNKQWNGW
mgnify:CR=1 FL=1